MNLNLKIKKDEKFYNLKQKEIDLFKIKYAKNPNKLKSQLKKLNKIQVFDKNLHEIKQEILVVFAGEFELVAKNKNW